MKLLLILRIARQAIGWTVTVAFWLAMAHTTWALLSYGSDMKLSSTLLRDSLLTMGRNCMMFPDPEAQKIDIGRRP